MEALKRGGRMKQKQKQKQSVVIKNVINIGKGERKKKAKRRAGTRRIQPQAMQPFIPAGQQFPLQKLFQPQQQVYRSVVMGSSTANEAVNNVSKVVDESQKISEGKVNASIENELEKNSLKRLLDGLDNPFVKKKLSFETPMPQPKKERKVRSDSGVKRKRILPPYGQAMEEKMIEENILNTIQEKRSNESNDEVKQKADELMDIINTTGERNQKYLNEKILEAKNKYNKLKEDDEDM